MDPRKLINGQGDGTEIRSVQHIRDMKVPVRVETQVCWSTLEELYHRYLWHILWHLTGGYGLHTRVDMA